MIVFMMRRAYQSCGSAVKAVLANDDCQCPGYFPKMSISEHFSLSIIC